MESRPLLALANLLQRLAPCASHVQAPVSALSFLEPRNDTGCFSDNRFRPLKTDLVFESQRGGPLSSELNVDVRLRSELAALYMYTCLLSLGLDRHLMQGICILRSRM
jgi:hypothetical protein